MHKRMGAMKKCSSSMVRSCRGLRPAYLFDSGYLVGDGIWEGIRLHRGRLCFLQDHFERLWKGAKAIGLQLPFTKKELERYIWETLRANDMDDGVHIRVMVTRGIKKTPSQDPRLTLSGPNVVIIAEHKIASEESRRRGLRLFTSTVRRGRPDYLDPNSIATTNFMKYRRWCRPWKRS